MKKDFCYLHSCCLVRVNDFFVCLFVLCSYDSQGRTDAQCRERYVNVLDPTIKRSRWTAAEDQRLLELAAQCERRWIEVAALLGEGRTDNQCSRRWRSIAPPELVSMAKRAQRPRKVSTAATQ